MLSKTMIALLTVVGQAAEERSDLPLPLASKSRKELFGIAAADGVQFGG